MASVAEALQQLEALGDEAYRAGMARYAITAPKAFGVAVGKIRTLSKRLGRDHALAQALWETGWYEARLLAAMVDDPEWVTPEQMDAWRADFDNWAVTDTLCFDLFDRTPHAPAKIDAWVTLEGEFDKRAGFVLLASVALHRKELPDAPFLERLSLIEAGSTDPRNFVKKGVNWALRAIGSRKSPVLRAAALDCAARLAASTDRTARWNGKDALRQLNRGNQKG
ncbi:DNA alkylation repair protein [Caulobacter sp. RL271]|jgi:3-methyladenine DNA glycosylase AlkD|uniref:DNA alkylation repair protein n=1 Tax=Caulobacter segnis TaxID=88688 RepID=A0ABY4ZNT5_9CAUL|nr:DNA alkylation repair protein [Caulobacter segnis]USQ93884.1 DNA alkylation repair protein [Caulobacter segnis]